MLPFKIENLKKFDGHTWQPYTQVWVAPGGIYTQAPATGTPCTHLEEALLVPAFTDLQIYGAAGLLFAQCPTAAALAALAAHNRQGGVHQCLVTIATQPWPVVLQCLQVVQQYQQQGGLGIAGLHLEGPFINPVRRGAHLEECVIPLTESHVEALLAYAPHTLRMITLAPECCPPGLTARLAEAGVLVSAGHSNASYQQGVQCKKAGVHVVTHLFNAMSPLHHRQPGLAAAAMLHPALCASIIPDGIHVDYAMLRMAKQVMGDRLFFITDAVTECSTGAYPHVYAGTHYTLPNGTLSGSAISMLQGVKNAVQYAGIELDEALRMASLYPERMLGVHSTAAAQPHLLLSTQLELLAWV